MEDFKESESAKAAIALAQNRQSIVEKYQLLSEARNVRQMEQDTYELIEYLNRANLFPISAPIIDEKKILRKKRNSWLLEESPQNGLAVAKRCEHDKDFFWVVNYLDGRIHMAYAYDSGMIMDRQDDLVLEIPEVIDSFLDRITKDFVPETGE